MRFPATRPLRFSFPALAAAVVALALAPAGSLAATHPLLGGFDGSETPAGSFAELGGLAVDGTSGDVYALDIGNDVIDKFDAGGHYLCQITGAGESSSSASECDKSAPGQPGGAFEFAAELVVGGEAVEPQIAVDNTATGPDRGDLYVATAGVNEEQALTPPASGEYTLSFEGETTESLAAEADAEEVRDVLQALPAIGDRGAHVASSAGHLLVNFDGRLLNTDVEQLTPSGGIPAASVTTVRQGAAPRIERFSPAGALLGEVAELPGFTMAGLVAAGGEISVRTASLESTASFPSGSFIGHVIRFTTAGSSTGSFDTSFPPSDGIFGAGFTVDSNADLYVGEGGVEIRKYSAGGSLLGRVRECADFTPSCGPLATDLATDQLYLIEKQVPEKANEPGITELSPQGEELGKFAQAQLANGGGGGIAIDPTSGTIYAASAPDAKVYRFATTGPRPTKPQIGNVKAVGFDVTATINPEGAELTRCAFEYGTDTSYGQSVPCEQSLPSIGSGDTPVTVSVHITGLTAGTVYHVRLAAANANGTTASADRSEETLAGPAIGETTATELTATGARLQARINPRGSDTHYRFEYGTDQSYGHSIPVPEADIGAGGSPVTATQELQGLSAGTTYHYRVVAQSHCNPGDPTEPCLSTGADHTFVFLAAESPGPCPANELLRNENDSLLLPDCRAYEQVTPTFKNGALIEDVSFVGLPHEVATDGSRVIATSIQCFAGSQSCPSQRGNAIGSPFSFERTAAGWQTTPLALSGQLFRASSVWSFDAGTGTALFSATTPPGEEDDFYVRHPDGSLGHVGPVTPPADGRQGPAGNGQIKAATADASHVLWTLGSADQQWPVDPSPPGKPTVYEYAGTENQQPFLVGVSGGQGSTDVISNCGTNLGGSSGGIHRNILSADGRIVFFTAFGHPGCFGTGANASREVPADALYARVDGESAAAHTVTISARSPSDCTGACLASPPAAAQFATAATDGSMVYFTSTQQLIDEASEDETPGDSADTGCSKTHGPSGCNIYLYDFSAPAGHELIDASAAPEPRVQGVVGASSDGSRLYFVAKGLLAGENAAGRSPVPGGANLYLYERNQAHPGGQLAFVTTLAASDSEMWEFGAGPANVTPNGRFLVFTSHARLTPDDSSLSGAQQVFRYDAVAHSLVRVSVGRQGFDDNGNRSAPSPCKPLINACSEDATIAFGSSPNATVSDDGSYVFFMSPVGLTPGALDDRRIGTSGEGLPVYAQNVYEWHEGEVSLISDGQDVTVNNGGEASCRLSSVCLLGTDASGHDVFFATADALTPTDTNTQLDYYDARVGGGFPPPATEGECLNDACKGPGSQVNEPASPASAGFNGPAEGPGHPQQHHKKKHKHRKRRGRHHHRNLHKTPRHAKHEVGGSR